MSRRAKLEAMLAAEPNDVFLGYALAKELATAGDAPAALAQFERVIAGHPDYVPAYFQQGQVLAEEGDTDAAREVLTRGLAVAQRLGDAHAAGEMAEFLEMLP